MSVQRQAGTGSFAPGGRSNELGGRSALLGKGGGIRAAGGQVGGGRGKGHRCSFFWAISASSFLFLLLSGPPPPPWSGSSSWQAATQSADAALQSRLPATLPQSGCWAPAAAHFQALGRQGSDVRLLTSGLTASPCQLSLPHSLS